jgi:hypothetical protein
VCVPVVRVILSLLKDMPVEDVSGFEVKGGGVG